VELAAVDIVELVGADIVELVGVDIVELVGVDIVELEAKPSEVGQLVVVVKSEPLQSQWKPMYKTQWLMLVLTSILNPILLMLVSL
jgi:hypothetical protein